MVVLMSGGSCPRGRWRLSAVSRPCCDGQLGPSVSTFARPAGAQLLHRKRTLLRASGQALDGVAKE
jgi:hypothetical protein